MTSNEHPDMSGNPFDQPYICEICGCTVKENEIYGSKYNEDAILCSNKCTETYDESIEQKRYDEDFYNNDRISCEFVKLSFRGGVVMSDGASIGNVEGVKADASIADSISLMNNNDNRSMKEKIIFLKGTLAEIHQNLLASIKAECGSLKQAEKATSQVILEAAETIRLLDQVLNSPTPRDIDYMIANKQRIE